MKELEIKINKPKSILTDTFFEFCIRQLFIVVGVVCIKNVLETIINIKITFYEAFYK